MTFLFAAATMAALPHSSASVPTLVVLCVLCTAWQCHLERASLPWTWSGPLAVLVTALLLSIIQHIPARPPNLRAGAILSGLLLYGMIWALAQQNSRRGLQAVASVALVLPLALFARPTILFAAAFLALLAMLGCGRKYGGYLQSALLVFTPTALCLIVALVLRSLAIATLRFPLWRVHLLSGKGSVVWHYTAMNGLRLIPLVPILAFVLVPLVIRMLKGKTGVPDFAYLVLLVCSLFGVLLHPSGDARAVSEIEVVASAGAMSLIAVAPPRQWSSRLLILFVSSLTLAWHTKSILQ